MEHEFEKLRGKVAEAEQNLVAWEKELVWSKIKQPERKTFVFYYAAASLLIASALFFYAYESTKQKEIELQLKAIELSIEKNKTLRASIGEQETFKESIACADPVVQPEIKHSPTLQKINRTKTKEIINPTIIEPTPNEEAINNTVVVSEPTATAIEVVASVTEISLSKNVQAIIGNNGLGSRSTSKDKKLKFRMFPEENTETVPAAAETISFHSKIN